MTLWEAMTMPGKQAFFILPTITYHLEETVDVGVRRLRQGMGSQSHRHKWSVHRAHDWGVYGQSAGFHLAQAL